MKVIAYIIFVGTVASSCGNENNSAAELQSQKAPAVSKEFLVEMSLAPAPEGRCPNGGVVQHYYYDVNANGLMDTGENSGLLPAIDCYEEVIVNSNPCENNLGKCYIPDLGVAKKIESCETANPEQLDAIAHTVAINSANPSPKDGEASVANCKRYLSEQVNYAFAFHYSTPERLQPKIGDFSIISLIKSVEQILIRGEPNTYLKSLRNLASIKHSPRIKEQLVLQRVDLKTIPSLDFLPASGAGQLQIHQTNVRDLQGLVKWSYQTKSPVTEIWESTITSTSGPHR
jgi:hypothetical protein